MEAKSIVQDLRDLADFLATRPELVANAWTAGVTVLVRSQDPKQLPALAKSLGTFGKTTDELFLNLTRRFGCLAIQVYVDREEVCEKRMVTKQVEEWVCPDSILALEEKGAAQ